MSLSDTFSFSMHTFWPKTKIKNLSESSDTCFVLKMLYIYTNIYILSIASYDKFLSFGCWTTMVSLFNMTFFLYPSQPCVAFHRILVIWFSTEKQCVELVSGRLRRFGIPHSFLSWLVVVCVWDSVRHFPISAAPPSSRRTFCWLLTPSPPSFVRHGRFKNFDFVFVFVLFT